MSDYQTVPPTTAAVTLAEAKAHLNVSSTADDAWITAAVDAATVMLESRCNRAFVYQTRALKMDRFDDCRYVHGRRIYPPRSPLASVSSVKYVDTAGTTTTMPSSDYIVSTGDKPGFVAEAYNATWPATIGVAEDVTITYVAGHSTVATGIPNNVKHAIKLTVAHWYRNREATSEQSMNEIPIGVDALLQTEHVELYG